MTKRDLRLEAVGLRKRERLSLREIQCRLSARVARSTLSLWLRETPLRPTERHEKMSASSKAISLESRARVIGARRSVFGRTPTMAALRHAAVGIAVEWFVSRGYVASLPVTAAVYDLVVESDTGLMRVQVKTTTHRRAHGWVANVFRQEYDGTATTTLRRRHVPYSAHDIDVFFIVTGDRALYLIPVAVVRSRTKITLDTRYKHFKV
jgi:hypothetical protein